MNYRIFYLALICLGLLANNIARAAVVEDLYTIELPVADQTTSLRLEVFSSGRLSSRSVVRTMRFVARPSKDPLKIARATSNNSDMRLAKTRGRTKLPQSGNF